METVRNRSDEMRQERRLLLLPRTGNERSLSRISDRSQDHLVGDTVSGDSLGADGF